MTAFTTQSATSSSNVSRNERRWEMGSSFHCIASSDTGAKPLPANWHLFASGSISLRHIVNFGLSCLGWKRLILPSYYCPAVVSTVSELIPVTYYSDSPIEGPMTLKVGADDVVLLMEYFGAAAHPTVEGGMTILDCSHHPTSCHGYARPPDFSLASLRKSLPIPDGGACWSSAAWSDQFGRFSATVTHGYGRSDEHVKDMYCAMRLKSAYLEGGASSKSVYLDLMRAAEAKIAGLRQPIGISTFSTEILSTIDVQRWYRRREANRASFGRLFNAAQSAVMLLGHPAYVVFVASSAKLADRIVEDLAQRSIFSARLWRQDPSATRQDIDLGERLFVLHVDGRYSHGDIKRMAIEVDNAIHEAQP